MNLGNPIERENSVLLLKMDCLIIARDCFLYFVLCTGELYYLPYLRTSYGTTYSVRMSLGQSVKALMVLKDGHVGSEWLAEVISRQPGTRFIFEMGSCITGNLIGKQIFVQEKRGCACSKTNCSNYRTQIDRAPCVNSPVSRSCALLGGSYLSVTPSEMLQWEYVLQNSSDVTILVLLRSNLVKWAWSFYRTGAMRPFRLKVGRPPDKTSEKIHRRTETNESWRKMFVDPTILLRTIVAKQMRSEKLLTVAQTLAHAAGQHQPYVLLYEQMQNNLEEEMKRLFRYLKLDFDVNAHNQFGENSLQKSTSEDLSQVVSNFHHLRTAFRRFPCLREMLTDTNRRIFDHFNCSWRTPIPIPKEDRVFPSFKDLEQAIVRVPEDARS